MNLNLKKLTLCDNDKDVFLFSSLNNNDFELIICDGSSVFRGFMNLGSSILDGMALSLSLESKEEAKEITLAALSNSPSSHEEFEYDLKALDSESCKLSWKREIEGTGLIQKLGEAKLSKLNDELSAEIMRKILTYASDSLAQAKNCNMILDKNCKRFEADRQKAVDQYGNCVASMVKREEELFSKFAFLLNEKKQEIKRLKSKVADLEETNSQDPKIEYEQSQSPSFDEERQSEDEIYGDETDLDSDEGQDDGNLPKEGPLLTSLEPKKSFSIQKLMDISSDEDDHL